MKNDIKDLDQHFLSKAHSEFSSEARKAVENFSECLNKLLDNEFLAIKKIFYPDTCAYSAESGGEFQSNSARVSD